MRRTNILLYIAFFCTYFGFPLKRLTENFSFISIVLEFSLQALVIGLLFIIYCNAVLFVGHLAQGIYYLCNGKGISTVLFYPFVFLGSDVRKIRVFKNFLYMVEPFYPSKLFQDTENIYDEEKVVKLCKTGHWCFLLAQIIICLLSMIIFLIKLQILFVIASGIMVGVFLSLALVESSSYHGVLVRNKYMSEGYGSLYFARQLILYSNAYHPIYDRFEAVIKQDINNSFKPLVIETIKHMYMINSINPVFLISTFIEKYAEERLFLRQCNELLDLNQGDEKFSLMKAYLYNAMIKNDKLNQNLLVLHLEELRNEASLYNKSFENLMNWYIKIGTEHEINSQSGVLFKNKLLRRNGLFLTFGNYKYIYESIIIKINKICDV